MLRSILIAALCLVAAACTTMDTRMAKGLGAPRTGATVLLVKPDVQLALLTAAGMREARADWTTQGTTNLENALEAALGQSSYTIKPIDPEDAMGGRSGHPV